MNLQKVFWVVLGIAILVCVGEGVYYLKLLPSHAPATSSPEVIAILTVQPTKPAISENLDELEFVVGNFQGWEKIEDSPDRYILLTNPKSGNLFPKIRVGFEFSPLFGFGGSKDITVFAVEKSEEEYDVLYALKYFTDEEIDKLIKKNDPIKIYLQWKLEKEENVKDEKDNLVAHWLLIKREGGKAEAEQELDREIKKPEIR